MLTYEEITAKTITLEKALEIFDPSFRETYRLVFTNGCFDVLHRGHIYYLSRAGNGRFAVGGTKQRCIGIKTERSRTDPSMTRSRPGPRCWEALAFVDYIILFSEDTPCN